MSLRIINRNLTYPQLYPKVRRRDPTVADKGYSIVGGFKLRDKIDFMPQRNLQEKVCHCDSNLIFMCGAMSMGKTYCMDIKGLYGIERFGYSGVMISVRLQDSKKGSSIFRDAVEVLGNFADCDYSTSDYPAFRWARYNSIFRLIHSNFNTFNPSEWEEFKDYAKKVQASYICIDEATEIKDFKMFTYWFGRNRDASGTIPQMVLSFNPEHDHWTTQMLRDAGYLTDDWYLNLKMNGVTRYWYNAGTTPKDIIWGDTPEDVARAANIVISEKDAEAGVTINHIVKSFTMFTGEAADNKILVSATHGQSIANLHALGSEQRAINKGAYFGPVEKETLEVTREMVRSLFSNPIDVDDTEMRATMDVSGGDLASDDCPMVIWKGSRMVAFRFFRGTALELVDWIDRTLKEYEVPMRNFAFDATGIGYYLKSYTSGIPVTANSRAIQEVDADGNPVTMEQYFNLRSQLLGKLKVMFERGDISCAIAPDKVLPYGKNGGTRRLADILNQEINVFRSTTRNKKIYYYSKEEYKTKFRSSPNLMDAIALFSRFKLDAKPRKQAAPVIEECAYDGFYSTDYDTSFFS